MILVSVIRVMPRPCLAFKIIVKSEKLINYGKSIRFKKKIY